MGAGGSGGSLVSLARILMVCAVSEAVSGGMAAHELMVLGVARGGPWPPRVEFRSDPSSSLGRANPPQVWRLLPPPSDGGKRRRSSAGRATISTIGRGSFVSWAAVGGCCHQRCDGDNFGDQNGGLLAACAVVAAQQRRGPRSGRSGSVGGAQGSLGGRGSRADYMHALSS